MNVSEGDRVLIFFPKEGRPKPIKKNPGPLEEKAEPVVKAKDNPKRKRDEEDDDAEAGRVYDVQGNPSPVKRARKTAVRQPGATKPKAVSSVSPPRTSQVLKKVRLTTKNANYGGRTKAARTSPPTRDSAAFSGDDFSDTLDLKPRPVDPRVEPPLMADGDDDYTSSPPALLKPKPKQKAAAKPKPTPVKKPVAPEKLKTSTVKAKAKTQAGTRTRVAVTRANGADEEIAKTGPPKKVKAKAKVKRKSEVLSMDEGEVKEGEEQKGEIELAKDSPAVIEVFSSPLEPPKAILTKRKPVSRVTLQEVHFNSSRCIHASRIVALIVHTRSMSQTTNPRPEKQQRTVPHRRRRSFSPKIRKNPGFWRWLWNQWGLLLPPLLLRCDLPPPKKEHRCR